MTTIAARVSANGKVKIAWDSQSTSGNEASSTSRNKVVKINDQFAVGVAGRVRFSNIVQRASIDRIHPHDILQPYFDAEGWLIETLVPAWMKAVKSAWHDTPAEEGDEIPWGGALVVLAGGIYKIGSDYSVVDCGDFGAIGSGSPYARTAMHLGKSAKQAVEIATQLDLFTGGDARELTV